MILTCRSVTQAKMSESLEIISTTHCASSGDNVGSSSPEPGALVLEVKGVGGVEVDVDEVGEA